MTLAPFLVELLSTFALYHIKLLACPQSSFDSLLFTFKDAQKYILTMKMDSTWSVESRQFVVVVVVVKDVVDVLLTCGAGDDGRAVTPPGNDRSIAHFDSV